MPISNRLSSQTCPISVILPIYNAEKTILRALNSILTQTCPPAEILCINDGSTDQSRDIISALNNSSIRIIDLAENRGVYTARNVGLENATQPYVAFLDADDFWHNQKLEIQYQILQNDPDLFLLAHQVTIWPHELEFTTDNITITPLTKAGALMAKPVNRHSALWFSKLRTISIVMKNTPQYRFDASKRRGGDMLLWLEIVRRGEKCALIPKTLGWKGKAHYGAGGLSADLRLSYLESCHTVESLVQKGLLPRPYAAILQLWGRLRYWRRLAIVALRRRSFAAKRLPQQSP